MNKERVRQVNKALKDELRFLNKSLCANRIRIEPKRINTYKVKQTVEENYLYQLSDDIECPMTYIKNSICNDLAKAIVKDTVFKIEPSTIPYHVDIIGTVSVLSDDKDCKENQALNIAIESLEIDEKYDLEFVRNEEEAEHYPIRSTKSDFELFRELRDNFLKSERGVVEI